MKLARLYQKEGRTLRGKVWITLARKDCLCVALVFFWSDIRQQLQHLGMSKTYFSSYFIVPVNIAELIQTHSHMSVYIQYTKDLDFRKHIGREISTSFPDREQNAPTMTGKVQTVDGRFLLAPLCNHSDSIIHLDLPSY